MGQKRDNPTISVIIPTYNRTKWLQQAITSALQQTYRDIEIFVVDDGSTDNTRELVANFNSPNLTGSAISGR